MADEKTKADALGIFLSGAASSGGVQNDPTLSLGNFRASKEVIGVGGIVTVGIPALVIRNATPSNGEGQGIINIDGDGNLVYTPPSESAGPPVTIAAGETKFLEGSDPCKGVRVFRSPDFDFTGVMNLDFVEAFNGVLGMEDIPDSERDSGEEYYRAFFVFAHGIGPFARLYSLIISQGGAGPRQSVVTFGKETPVGGAIQTIPDEFTAPAAITFESVLNLGDLLEGDLIGIWIKKTFPQHGAGKAREKIGVSFSFQTAT